MNIEVDNTYFVYGSERQYKVFKYIFSALNFCGFSENLLKVYENRQNNTILLCGKDKEIAAEQLRKNEDVKALLDDELIKTLNFPLENYKGKRIFVWGTGYWCGVFEKWMADNEVSIPIEGYIDNDPGKWNTFRNNVPVVSPDSIKDIENISIFVATDLTHFYQIKKQCDGKNEALSQKLISVHEIMDDLTLDFYKIYKAEYFYDSICKNRDDNVRIRRDGRVSCCCMASASNYGNLYYSEFSSIWNSPRARINRLSIMSRTFVFCDHDRCPFLSNVEKKRIQEGYDFRIDAKVEAGPETIAPEIDISCNLHCISCRNEVIADSSECRDIYTDMIIDKAVLPGIRMIVNTIGEPFASKNSIKLLHHPKLRSTCRLGVYTNGTLLFPEVLDKLLEEHEDIYLSISVDAVTEETYKTIRRGGNFTDLSSNLRYISRKRKENMISFLQLNFVVQAANVKEMSIFADWARELGCDRVVMNAIENWGIFDDEGFKKVSVIEDGSIKREYVDYFTEELVNDTMVNFYNLAHFLGLDPPRMTMI